MTIKTDSTDEWKEEFMQQWIMYTLILFFSIPMLITLPLVFWLRRKNVKD